MLIHEIITGEVKKGYKVPEKVVIEVLKNGHDFNTARWRYLDNKWDMVFDDIKLKYFTSVSEDNIMLAYALLGSDVDNSLLRDLKEIMEKRHLFFLKLKITTICTSKIDLRRIQRMSMIG